MALSDRFQHTMRIVTVVAAGALIEGQRDEQEAFSPAIACLLTTAEASEQSSASGRRDAQGPVLLCAPVDTTPAAAPVALRRGTTVEVTAPLIHAANGLADPSRYEIAGVQPLMRPGSPPMGFNATLSRIDD